MINEFIEKYTPVRNYLDQCIIGTREIEYDEVNNIYYEEEYNDYSNYARVLDKVKEDPNEELKNKSINSIGAYLSSNKFKSNIFKDRFFVGLMNDYKKMCRQNSEIDFNYDFGDFKYDEIISYSAAITLMADYYTIMFGKQPCPSIEYDTLVKGISKLSDLKEEKVELFLDYQTYDYEFQKDRLTLFQDLIICNDKVYFQPFALSYGRLPDKMYKLIRKYDEEKYKKDISTIANIKEKQMTDKIVEKLINYDLKIELNHIIKQNNQDAAEYDMLVFDNQTNNLYIFEFKWYSIGDGELEHKNIDSKLAKAIKDRKVKNKLIFDEPQRISEELFDGKKINNIYEILFSQNFCGNIKHDMTVIDYETFQWSIDRHDSFLELMEYFITDEFRKSIPLQNESFNVEIEGYKFKIFGIMIY